MPKFQTGSDSIWGSNVTGLDRGWGTPRQDAGSTDSFGNYGYWHQKPLWTDMKDPYNGRGIQLEQTPEFKQSVSSPIIQQPSREAIDEYAKNQQRGSTNGSNSMDTADKINAGVSGVSTILGNTMSQLNQTKSTDQYLADAGTSQGSVMGVGYTTQNSVNKDKILGDLDKSGATNTLSSTASGVTAGAQIGGPWGAVIGGVVGLGAGLFSWLGGKSKARKRLEAARQLAIYNNNYNRSSAMTTGLQQKYYNENGDTTGQILYGAYHGKDLRKPKYEG